MTNTDSLNILPVWGFDETRYQQAMQDYQNEREEHINQLIEREKELSCYGLELQNENLWDDDDDDFTYSRPIREELGISQDILESLLGKVGADGGRPAMATALYHAGIKSSGSWPDDLYGPSRIDSLLEDVWYQHLFAAYLQGQRKDFLVVTEPDALVLIQGRGRKPYGGYRSVTVDTWLNESRIKDGSVDRSVLGQEVLRRVANSASIIESKYNSTLPPVERDTQVLQLDDIDRVYTDSEWVTIDKMGFTAGEYNFNPTDEKLRQWGRLSKFEDADINTYEYAELIQSYKCLYEELDLDVAHVDMEDGEHYDFELNFKQIGALNEILPAAKEDPITGIVLAREDRPPGYWYTNDYYINSWGDMTIRVDIERESMTTTYSLVVFMDPSSPKGYTHLEKYHTPTRRYATNLQSEAAHLLAVSEKDSLDSELGLDEIDGSEYKALVQLIDSVRAVSTTIRS